LSPVPLGAFFVDVMVLLLIAALALLSWGLVRLCEKVG
jgi:hypothetical protein